MVSCTYKGKIRKIGIVTITSGPNNYGNQLQNLAAIKTFEKIGVEAATLYDIYSAEFKVYIRHKLKVLLFATLKIGDYQSMKKEIVFNSFSRKNLHYTRPINGYIPQNIIRKYDYFVVGSDQVWNPFFSNSIEHWKYYLLDFAPDEKRISYAASIGVPKIDETPQTDFRLSLLKYKSISVREESGQHTIKELPGRDAEVLIYPTLMLDPSDWLTIAKRPKKVDTKKPYILTYFLDGRSERINRILQKNTVMKSTT